MMVLDITALTISQNWPARGNRFLLPEMAALCVLRGQREMLNVNNTAEAGQICNIACLHQVTDFLFPEEEESLLEGNHEDTCVVLSSCCVFT